MESRFAFVLIALWFSFVTGYSQADAGPDQTICDQMSVQIGTTGSGSYCYSWSPETGLSDPHSPAPSANPDATTTYTLTVTSSDFSFRGTDQVTVTVTVGEVTFSPDYLIPDGASQAQASVSGAIPPGETLAWSIQGSSLGCTIDPNFGLITAGMQFGTITVRATLDPSGCYNEAELEVNGAVKDVTAEDPDHPGRIAHAGETLSLVGHNNAKITAIPADGSSFPPDYPKWGGNPPDGTVMFTDNSALDESFTAGDKTVNVERLQDLSNSVGLENFVGAGTIINLRDKLKFNSPTGASLSVSFDAGNSNFMASRAEKYMDPGWDNKYELVLGVRGEIVGRITHPAFSGSFSILGQDIAVWELYAETGIGLGVTGGAEKDPSVAMNKWRGTITGTATGRFQVGYYVFANISIIQLEGDLNASTSIFASARLAGCTLQNKYGWGGIVGNVSLTVYTDPNDPFVNYLGTVNLIDGNDTGWVTFWDLCSY